MVQSDEAEFVIVGGRLSHGALGYQNHNGDFVDLPGAATYGFDEALVKAADTALALTATVYVAPLLFGIPDMDNCVTIEPPRYPEVSET